MPGAAATPMPRRGRPWVIAALLLAVFALGYAVVEVSTQEAGRESVRIAGIEGAQATFGGVRQEGDRLGHAEAPVSVQIFNDLQCGGCAPAFLDPIPPLVTERVRAGEAKLLLRHYSFARNPVELGFFGAEAAAEQGYGWQYTYLFFRNQDEAERFGVGDELLESIAGAIGELDVAEWNAYLDAESGPEGEITRRLQRYEELGRELGIRAEPAAVVNGPGGTRILQGSPDLAAIDAAIEEVR